MSTIYVLLYTNKWYILWLMSNWQIWFTSGAEKQLRKLPQKIRDSANALRYEIELLGPIRFGWKNFGKLGGEENKYHCHLNSGRPTYVICWKVVDKKLKIIEVYYAGTHEKAPY